MPSIKKLVCKSCNKKFTFKNITSINKYCSWRCFQNVRNERKKLKRLNNIIIIKLNCKFCNKKFKKPNNIINKYCSKSCSYKMDLKRDKERKKHLLNTDSNFRKHYYEVRKAWAEKNKDKVKEYLKKARSKESYKIKRRIYHKKYMQIPEVREHRKKLLKKYYWENGYREKKKQYKLKNRE